MQHSFTNSKQVISQLPLVDAPKGALFAIDKEHWHFIAVAFQKRRLGIHLPEHKLKFVGRQRIPDLSQNPIYRQLSGVAEVTAVTHQ